MAPFRDRVLYLPGDKKIAIEAEISVEEVEFAEKPIKVYKLESLKHETIELLQLPTGRKSEYNHHEVEYEKFMDFIAEGLAIPRTKLNLITQYPPTNLRRVEVPFFYRLGKGAVLTE